MRISNDMSNEQLADELAELDLAIETDQSLIANARRRIRNNSQQRDTILDILSHQASRKGWR